METKSHTVQIKNNVSKLERVMMVLSGAYLLYSGLAHKEKKFNKKRFWRRNASKRY